MNKHYLVLLVAALVMAVVPNALAFDPPQRVPDAGSTGLMVAAAVAGLGFARSLISRFRK